MAISYVGAGNIWTDESAGTSFTFNKPSAAIEGDLLIGLFESTVTDPSCAPPTGWTLIRRTNETTTFPRCLLVATRTVLATDDDSWTNGTCASSSGRGTAVVAYRGCADASLQFIDEQGNKNNTAAQTHITTPVTNTEDGAWVVFAFSSRDGTANRWKVLGSTDESQLYGRTGGLTGSSVSGSFAFFDSYGPVSIGSHSYTGTVHLKDDDTDVNADGRMHWIGALLPADEPPRIPVEPFGISEEFFDQVQRSGEIVSYVDVISPTNEKVRLEATGGEVQVDRSAAVRRRCTVSCIDSLNELTPDGINGILTPYGTEIRPYRGVVLPNGQIEAIPLGIFRLSKVTVDDTSQGLKISLEAYDLSRTVARDKFSAPYVVYSGTNVVQALTQIIQRTFPEAVYDITGAERVVTTTRVYDTGADPWAAATELAMSVGYDLYFDIQGRVVIAPPTDIDSLSDAEYSYAEGPDCQMLSLERVYTDEPGYNGVVVTGESPSNDQPAVQAVAWDTDPNSVTYHRGPYGEVPMFHKDQIIKTVEQAQDTANQLLKNLLGFASQVSLQGIVNPALECGDIIQVVRAKSHVDDLFILDAFNIPLSASGAQELVLRQKRTATSILGVSDVESEAPDPDSVTPMVYVGEAHVSNSPNNVADDQICNVPSGVVNGDVLIAMVYKAPNSTHTLTAPGGWTAINTATDHTNIGMAMFYRVASAEPSSYTWVVSGTGIWGVATIAIRGIDTGAVIHTSNKTTYGSSDPLILPAITTTVPTCLIFATASRDDTTTEVRFQAYNAGLEAVDWGSDGGSGTRNGAIHYYLGAGGLGANDQTYNNIQIDPTGSPTQSIAYSIALTKDV